MARRTQAAPAPAPDPGPWVDAEDSRVTWAEVDHDLLATAIDAVSRLGHGIILGRTSDGGALSICVLAGASKPRVYADSAESADLRLKQIVAWAVDLLSVAERI